MRLRGARSAESSGGRDAQGVEERTTPAEPGTTRVVIDANGERAVVKDVVETFSTTASVEGYSASGHGEKLRPVCLTPCVADLTPGTHVLRFASETSDHPSEITVQSGDKGKVIRHAMGRTEEGSGGHVGAIVLATLGITAAVVGGSFLGASYISDSAEENFRTPGTVTTAAGLGAVLVSIPLLLLTRPVRQPGATTEMPLTF